VLAGRIALPFLLPAIVDRLVAKQDLAVSWDDSQLVLRRGEVGYSPGQLSQAAKESEDLAAFERRMVVLHLEALEARDPATRVQAYDWLRLRGRDVPGYDPLGNEQARRSALAAGRAEEAGP